MTLVEPTRTQVLEYCARDPVERVFLEDAARRGFGRFAAVTNGDGAIVALCHSGANLVPSGEGCEAFAPVAVRSQARMIIGEARAVDAVWQAAEDGLPPAREDRPRQPVYAIRDRPPPGETGLRPARPNDLEILVPACAAAHELELGIDPLSRDADGFRWRTSTQIEDGRSWLWVEDGVVLFKAEASAWTPRAVQLAQVWTDPGARGHGYATRGLADLCRLLLDWVPVVTLFVRSENEAAIGLYEKVGMRKVLEYRSVLF
ncbi:MAG TPA: GNAT family N-acetyltransferase [Gaiellaceae bacterium]|nr:GNAT family N-acetyltransferase [Gaiellaceae bacterium]